ncbi:MAG: DUF928 domain-containing protein [Leptolyngbyaceae cyanobacterium SM1_4_3]|nr:DUF928 domain-containing protein [Leptolyngbyaceae cyanobacterium SM1_4_3]
MTRFSWLPNRALRYTALTSGALGLVLLTAPYALADYVPPSEPSSPQESTSSTGRRGGCDGEAETELTALAPQSYVGQTISTHPTFAWFIPDTQPFQVEFRLFEYNSAIANSFRRLTFRVLPELCPGHFLQTSQDSQLGSVISGRWWFIATSTVPLVL